MTQQPRIEPEQPRQFERGCDVISVEEAAHRLGRRPDTIKEWIAGGHVSWGQYIQTDKSKTGTWIIRRAAFELWLRGDQPVIQLPFIINTPEGFDELCRVAIDRMVGR